MIKPLIAAVFVSLALSPPGLAQDKKDPSAAQKRQQARMKNCNEKASAQNLKGDDRQRFMSGCLKGEDKMSTQQSRMKDCNKQASDSKMKGDDRKKFMSTCLKG
jgi:hypothetical protein